MQYFGCEWSVLLGVKGMMWVLSPALCVGILVASFREGIVPPEQVHRCVLPA